MEELFYLPPRAQAPIIDYGAAVGNPPRLFEPGAHNRQVAALWNSRRSSRPCSVIFSFLIDNHLDSGCRSHSDRRRHELDHGRALRGLYSPPQPAGRQLFAPAAEFNLQFHHRTCAAHRSKPQFQRFIRFSEVHRDQGAPSNCCSASVS